MSKTSPEEIGHLREQLILSVDGQFEWRERTADEYPSDARNRQAADSLRRLFESLEALAPDHAVWVRYANAFIGRAATLLAEPLRLGEIEQEYLRRYGFDAEEDGDAAKFLEGLIEELESEVMDAQEPKTRVQ